MLVNTHDQAIDEDADGVTDYPAGPFVRLSVNNLSVTAASVTVTGSAVFEISSARTVIAVDGLAVTLGTDAMTSGSGGFVITDTGIAGVASGTVAGVRVGLRFN